jgi:hypothetical protein
MYAYIEINNTTYPMTGTISLFFVFIFQSRFKNSYWNDLKQLNNTDLNEVAEKLPTIAKSSKSANSIKKTFSLSTNLNRGVQITICLAITTV